MKLTHSEKAQRSRTAAKYAGLFSLVYAVCSAWSSVIGNVTATVGQASISAAALVVCLMAVRAGRRWQHLADERKP